MNYIETTTTSTIGINIWQCRNLKIEEQKFEEFRDSPNQQQLIDQGITQGWIIDLGTSTITFED